MHISLVLISVLCSDKFLQKVANYGSGSEAIDWLHSILQEPEWDTRMAYLSYHIGEVRVHSLSEQS
jgi:hypothetical protein